VGRMKILAGPAECVLLFETCEELTSKKFKGN
jgi:hypothetical protein